MRRAHGSSCHAAFNVERFPWGIPRDHGTTNFKETGFEEKGVTATWREPPPPLHLRLITMACQLRRHEHRPIRQACFYAAFPSMSTQLLLACLELQTAKQIRGVLIEMW